MTEEAIEDEADPVELKGTDYFRIIGFIIDKEYREQGIGSKKFYEKMGFRNTNVLNNQDYFFIK